LWADNETPNQIDPTFPCTVAAPRAELWTGCIVYVQFWQEKSRFDDLAN